MVISVSICGGWYVVCGADDIVRVSDGRARVYPGPAEVARTSEVDLLAAAPHPPRVAGDIRAASFTEAPGMSRPRVATSPHTIPQRQVTRRRSAMTRLPERPLRVRFI